MRKLDDGAEEIGDYAKFDALSSRVQEGLGELAGAAKDRLRALSGGVGRGVLIELMAEEVVRHEALSDRAGVRDLVVGSSQRPAEAWGQAEPGATGEGGRKPGFSDLHNLVCDSATLLVAWRRLRGNPGSRSAGIDGQTAYEIEVRQGVERLLGELRAGTFRPVAVKERAIPKLRHLGIPLTVAR